MKKISLSINKNILLALALSTSFVFLSEKSHAQKNSSETMMINSEISSKNVSSINADAVKDVISIQNNNGTHGIAKIYCESGKKISESILQTGTNTINVSSLVHGTYIISVTMDGGETYNQKFTKE